MHFPGLPRLSAQAAPLRRDGRSRARGWLTQLAGHAVESGPPAAKPAADINPVAVRAMAEGGIDIGAQRPKILRADAVTASDLVITMGCGDACPYCPGKRYEDWTLDDPAGQNLDQVRRIRDRDPSASSTTDRRGTG